MILSISISTMSAVPTGCSVQLTLECGSNSQFPPPANPSAAASCLLPAPVGPPIPIGGRSPVAVALTLDAPGPRWMDTTISSTTLLILLESVREKRPGDQLFVLRKTTSSPPFSSTTNPVFRPSGRDVFAGVRAPWNSNSLNLPSGGTNDSTPSRNHLLYLSRSALLYFEAGVREATVCKDGTSSPT